MATLKYDLLVRAGRLFCAASRLDGPGAVAIRDGRIVASGPGVVGPASQTLEFPQPCSCRAWSTCTLTPDWA